MQTIFTTLRIYLYMFIIKLDFVQLKLTSALLNTGGLPFDTDLHYDLPVWGLLLLVLKLTVNCNNFTYIPMLNVEM